MSNVLTIESFEEFLRLQEIIEKKSIKKFKEAFKENKGIEFEGTIEKMSINREYVEFMVEDDNDPEVPWEDNRHYVRVKDLLD